MRKKDPPLLSQRIMTTLPSSKRKITQPCAFLTPIIISVQSLIMPVSFFKIQIHFKGPVSEHSSATLWCWSWFWFLSSLAHSFIPPLSQLFSGGGLWNNKNVFYFSCGLTHNICFQFDIWFWNRNSWERNWRLHDGSKISSLQKSTTYPSNLSPPDLSFHGARSALLPSAPLRFPLLVQVQTKSPHRVLWERL